MRIEYLGHAAFYVESDQAKILIDPFLIGSPSYDGYLDRFNDVDYIFVTHGHGDHIGDSVQIAKASGATIISNFEIVNHLGKFGVQCHAMHIGGRFKFPFGTVKMTPALHGSGIQTENGLITGGNPAGFVIELEGKKLYHAGDTGLTMDMKLLEIEELDIAMLPIGGNFTMDIADALRAVTFIKPKKVIPMHYDTFDVIKAEPMAFVNGLESGVEGIILKSGESYSL